MNKEVLNPGHRLHHLRLRGTINPCLQERTGNEVCIIITIGRIGTATPPPWAVE